MIAQGVDVIFINPNDPVGIVPALKEAKEKVDGAPSTIKEAAPNGKVNKGDVHMAVVVRTVKETKRKDGSTIKFDTNAAVMLNKNSKDMIGTRIFGPVPR